MLAAFLESRPRLHEAIKTKKKINPYRKGTASFFPSPSYFRIEVSQIHEYGGLQLDR